MRVLIAGGAGFIGSHLCDHYLGAGWDVLCVDNLLTGTEENIAHLAGSPGFTLLRQDVAALDPGSIPDGLDAVLHFASPASPRDYYRLPLETLRVNSLGTERLLEVARRRRCRFLFASTSEVYGDPTVAVQDESYWGNVNPVGPRSVYDEAKRYGEAVTSAYARTHDVDTAIVRIFNTYGPRMRPDDGRVVPNFLVQALAGKPLTIYGDGLQTRSFCYVDDLVRGIAALAASTERGPLNLGNPEEFTVLQLAARVRSLVAEVPIEFRPGVPDDPRRRRPDITRARELLGWQPTVSLIEGLRRTAAHLKERTAP